MVPELPPIAVDGWYSQTRVARLLGVSYDSVHRWLGLPFGKGMRFKINKRTGYPEIQGREIVRFFNTRY